MKASYMIKLFGGTLIFYTILFISAGTINYMQGLVYAAIGFAMLIIQYTVLRIDPELVKERAKPGEGTLQWDKIILLLSFFLTIAMFVVAGLDSGRYHWSPEMHPAVFVLGILLTIAGQLIFLIAQKQNRFFSSTVRIQKDREHTVCETGLYKFVRHPGYLGTIIQAVGFPMIMGSLWSILPISLSIILFIIRTDLEDKTLRLKLNGYTEYSDKTRYKLIPYFW
ncbi:MAG TPA: isoprenylcysteine carboxylmethyltransferase family protein [Bacteroidales bacterium]|nr:isoprenylcysteine carboxylmethyltransferase family protein [Bacteroidales bacterium]